MGSLFRTVALVPIIAMAGCAHDGAQARPAISADWRTVATPADRSRLRGWRSAFVAALASATQAGKAHDIAAEGALLQPDAAQGDPAPPPGRYRCRTIKLGAKAAGSAAFVSYPASACRIAREGDLLSLARLAGSQRPVGLLFPDRGAARMVFLGTMMLGDERSAQQYGRDTERDMIGALEAIGPRRWRLVLPAPRWESLIDVVEVVPDA